MGLMITLVLLCAALGAIVWLYIRMNEMKARHKALKEAYARDMNELNTLRGRRDHAVMVGVHDQDSPPKASGDLAPG